MSTEKIKTTYREAMRAAIRDALLRDDAGVSDGRGCRPLWRLLCGKQGPAR